MKKAIRNQNKRIAYKYVYSFKNSSTRCKRAFYPFSNFAIGEVSVLKVEKKNRAARQNCILTSFLTTFVELHRMRILTSFLKIFWLSLLSAKQIENNNKRHIIMIFIRILAPLITSFQLCNCDCFCCWFHCFDDDHWK